MIRHIKLYIKSYMSFVQFLTIVATSTFIFCTALFVSFNVYHTHKSTFEFEALKSGIESELSILQTQGDEIASDPKFAPLLEEEDSYNLLAFLFKQRDERGIGLLGVTDKDGYIKSRTRTTTARGDNSFLNSAIGRSLYGGLEKSASVEASSINPR